MSIKVRCANCTKENKGVCSIKKTKVHTNKSRICDFFVLDKDKLKTVEQLPTTLRPEWYWNRKEYIRKAKKAKQMVKNSVINQMNNPKNKYIDSATPEHPLTGDLSRFVTTAGSNNEETKTTT